MRTFTSSYKCPPLLPPFMLLSSGGKEERGSRKYFISEIRQNKYLPLNVKEPFRNQNFTLKWSHYEDDAKLTIFPEVIKDIYEWTNGHAGLVCFCGKAISSLEKELDERRCLDFVLWSNFVTSLQPTVRSKMCSPQKQQEHSRSFEGAIRCFDKEIISRALSRSFKIAKMYL
ncbi:hypothetical protein RhiirA1_500647 [Rhizophagus irregularis]|uniref:Uncharacterized protein n=1 Tax=Rhizophagus irregularis TaxID=588596 RepID=A0A2N0S4V9_9GLOM|nr:hypothetical protein RhiirA1_500647 [Rhizophagus irregularis]